MKIVFMGTPVFARIILEKLHPLFSIVGVVAQPDRPSGRGHKLHSPPVAEFATQQGLPLFQPTTLKSVDLLQHIREIPDFIVVAAYGKILPSAWLTIPRSACLNVHASILPEYRGASPINAALLHGKKETGISLMRLVPQLDAGPVYTTRRLPILESDDTITLTEKLALLGAKCLIESLHPIKDATLLPIEQEHDKATYAPKLTRDLSRIVWSQPAEQISHQIRGLVPWPIAHTRLHGLTLKVFRALPLSHCSDKEPGTIVHLAPKGLTVCTGTTDLLIQDVQLENKKRMNAFDLANGLRLKVFDRLES